MEIHFIHLPTIAAIMTLGPCTHFNCLWISSRICPISVKNLITACTSHAKSFMRTSIFACAYLAFYWSTWLKIFTVCIQTQKLNFPWVWLRFINHRSIKAQTIFTFRIALVQRLSQNTVEFLDTHSLQNVPEFSGSWSCRAFQDKSKESMKASV